MKIKKVVGTLCDFSNIINIWLDGFLNYFMVIVDFFGVALPSLFWTLLTYHFKVCYLSQIYDWQHMVLTLAIDYHNKIRPGTTIIVETQVLLQHWIN